MAPRLRLPLVLLGLAAALFGCVAQPRAEKSNPLHYLNGNYYQLAVQPDQNNYLELTQDAAVNPELNQPVSQSDRIGARAPGRLQGTAVVRSGLFDLPLKMQQVRLEQNGQTLQEVMTDSSGRFEFTGTFEDGEYTVSLRSDRYKGRATIQIEAYELLPVSLVAVPVGEGAGAAASGTSAGSSR